MFTAEDMYFRHSWEKFQQQVQTLLSKKPKKFSEIFIAFFQSTQNFAHFQKKKKNQNHKLNISQVIDTEKCGYLNAWKLLF